MAQIADFTVTPDPCIGQYLSIVNNSVNADQYQWDFCEGDFSLPAITNQNYGIQSSGNLLGLDIVNGKDGWYGFLTSFNNSIIRLSFGDDLDNEPIADELTFNPNPFNNSYKASVLNVDGDWIALISNFNGGITKLDFGNSLSNPPVPSSVSVLPAGSTASSRMIDIVEDQGNFYGLVANSANNVALIDFGTTIGSEANASQIITPGSPIGVKLFVNEGVWHGFITSSEITHFTFGDGLANPPTTISNITVDVPITNATNIEIERDAGNFFMLLGSTSGNLKTINLGTDLSSNEGTLIQDENLGVFSSALYAISGAKQNSEYNYFGISQSSDQIHKIEFTNPCQANIPTSKQAQPSNVFFHSSGQQIISLKAINSSGIASYTHQNLIVTNAIAPDIDFISTNQCISNSNIFFPTSSISDLIYAWDFDNDNVTDSSQETPTFQFVSPGTYDVSLIVQGTNACSNSKIHEIAIYSQPPVPDFEITNETVCSNTSLMFSNLSDESAHMPEILSYTWDFDGVQESTDTSPLFTFDTAGTKQVSLTMSIPGCESFVSKNVEVIAGPDLEIGWTNNCFGEEVQFSSTIIGDDSGGYQWDFDGDSFIDSFEPSGGFNYSLPGEYTVSLQVSSANECETRIDSSLIVNDMSLVNFEFDQLIQNLPVNFVGLDLTSSSDLITEWQWDFNGLGTSLEQNPVFVFPNAQDYTINLDIFTSQGCIDTFSNVIRINEAIIPSIEFTVQASTCLNENLLIENNSVNATHYEWDFCEGDLGIDGETLENYILPSSSDFLGLEIVDGEDGWYGFLSSFSSSFYRLDFGNNLNSAPSIELIEFDTNPFNNSYKTSVVKSGGSWLALVSNFDGTITKLDFGNSLSNSPIPSSITVLPSGITGPSRMLDVVKDDDNYYGIMANSSNNVAIIDFGSSIESQASATQIVVSGSPIGVKLYHDNGLWHGFVSSDELTHLIFENGLNQPPTINRSISLDLITSDGTSIEIERDGGRYYMLLGSLSGNLKKIDLGIDLNLSTGTVIQNSDLGVLASNLFAISGAKQNSNYYYFGISQGQSKIYKIQFEKPCKANNPFSKEFLPSGIQYNLPGEFSITLKATNANGKSVYSTQNLITQDVLSPDIGFYSFNQCILSSNTFTFIEPNPDAISSYSWDFNSDGIEDASESNPTYQFQDTGTFEVSLVVQASNGCSNNVSQAISIYPEPPTPDFETTNETICSNSKLTFSNLSDESNHTSEVLSYTWDFDSVQSNTETNPSYTFDSGGTKEVSLTMSIPGCESFISKNIEVIAGPDVAFQFEGDCAGSEIPFSNQTTGEGITGHLWDFSDGSTNTNSDPSHIFTQAGNYKVSLQSTNDVGCINSLSQTITVHSLPSAAFISEIGCANAPLQFNDASLVDNANITSWNWDFDGLGNSEEKNPTFTFETAGEYEVTLTSMSNFGCQETTSQTVIINQSPSVEFETILGCLNETTSFTDLTPINASNPITSWFWEIDDDVSTLQNPTYVFTSSGIHDVSLTVTTANNCAIKVSKEINVISLPEVDFSVDNECDNEFTNFTDESISSSLIVSRGWNFAGLSSANGLQAAYQFPESGSYDVTLTTVTEDLCVNTLTKSVQINESPVAVFDVDVNLGAPPLEVQFTNNSTGATSYTWTFDDPENSTSTESDPKFIFNQIKDHNVSLLAANEAGCTDISFATIKVSVPELDLELVKLEPSLNDDKINLTLTIANRGTVRADGLDINIALENDLTISESFDEVLNAGEEIIYPLNFEIPVANSNVGFVCIQINDRIADIQDSNGFNNEKCANFEQQVVIENPFPNPSNDEIAIKIVLPNSADLEISLTNIQGETVYIESFSDLQSGLNSFLLDIRNYNQGMYFMKIQSGQTEQIRRIIKF